MCVFLLKPISITYFNYLRSRVAHRKEPFVQLYAVLQQLIDCSAKNLTIDDVFAMDVYIVRFYCFVASLQKQQTPIFVYHKLDEISNLKTQADGKKSSTLMPARLSVLHNFKMKHCQMHFFPCSIRSCFYFLLNRENATKSGAKKI